MANSILIVDDEADNVELLEEYLQSSDYLTLSAFSGEEALQILNQRADEIDAIFLDRMMPGMDGMEVLKNIKNDDKLSGIPVIFQTAKADPQSTLDGLKAGAYYYLSKPYDREQALAILDNATSLRQRLYRTEVHARSLIETIKLMRQGEFEFRTIAEAISVAKLLALTCPNSDTVSIGLSELLINAVEHGNLGLNFTDKSNALDNQNWEELVEKRLQHPEHRHKRAKVQFDLQTDKIVFVIRDEGSGFNFNDFNEFKPERLMDSHGRGIMMARATSFSSVEYQGCGNEVIAVMQLN
jgi:CheY-like chemotaxis protein